MVMRPWMVPPHLSIMPFVSAPSGTTANSLAAQIDSASSPRACSALTTRGVSTSRSRSASMVSPPRSTQ
eukprot:7074184-Prymnesium_polylepis.1